MLFRPGMIVLLAIYISLPPSVAFNFHRKVHYRLPNDTKPVSYDIHITTNIPTETSNFIGSVVITLKVVNDTREIIVHASDLEVGKISLVYQESSFELKNVEFAYNFKNQFLTIYPQVLLKSGGIYVLTIAYKGRHSKKSRGFFTSSYFDLDGNEVVLATTNFQATYARNAFPCYDEPAFKATFSIALTHNKLYTALSNMPQDGEPVEEEDGMVTTKFIETQHMSTYAVAFLITTHRYISVKEGEITHRVFSPPISKSDGKKSLQVATKITRHLEEYFDIKYPLPKIDHISIPRMTLTAMENWGLIVYQFGFLLPTSNNSHLYDMTTFSVIAHELAHQWVGNLVTPKWWSYNWMNEGIAAFYAGKVMQFLYPEWNTDEVQLFMEGVQSIEKEGSPPLMQYVETRKEIKETFNHYFESAYLLRMFEHALTENTFKNGMTQYLKDHQYSVTDEDDLFNNLQAAATEDKIKYFEEAGQVAKIMRTWTNQKDFPYITVIRDYETGEVRLIQKNLVGGNYTIGLSTQVKRPLWWIPITYTTAASPDFEDTTTDFIFPQEDTIVFDPKESGHTLNDNDWLILNKKRIGLYNVNYDEKNWQLIIETLRTYPQRIHVWNRALLIRDAWKFVQADVLPNQTLLDLLRYLQNEYEPLPWHEAVIVLRDMLDALTDKSSIEKDTLKYYIQDVIANIYAKIGIDHIPLENPLWEKIRPNLFGLACDSELVDCKPLIEAKYKDAMDGTLEDTYMIKEVYCQYLKQATDTEAQEFKGKLSGKNIYPFDTRQTELLLLVLCHPSLSFAIDMIIYTGLNVNDLADWLQE